MSDIQNTSNDESLYEKLISLWQEAFDELTSAQILIDQSSDGLRQASPHLIRSWYLLAQLELARTNKESNCKLPDSFSSFRELIPQNVINLIKEKKREAWLEGLDKVFSASQQWWQCQFEEITSLEYKELDLQQNCLDQALSTVRSNLDQQFEKTFGAMLKRNWKWVTAALVIIVAVTASCWKFFENKNQPGKPISIGELSPRIIAGGPWDAPTNKIFEKTLEITLPQKIKVSSIDVAFDNNDSYRIEFYDGKKYHSPLNIGPRNNSRGGMVRYQERLKAATTPTDQIRITAISGDGKYSIGHLKLQ